MPLLEICRPGPRSLWPVCKYGYAYCFSSPFLKQYEERRWWEVEITTTQNSRTLHVEALHTRFPHEITLGCWNEGGWGC